jgi:hypothetical protein
VTLQYLPRRPATEPAETDAFESIAQRGQTVIVIDDATLADLHALHEHAGAIGIVPICDAERNGDGRDNDRLAARCRQCRCAGDVFTRASQLVHDDGATLASALLVVVDTEARSIEYVSAGHPPPSSARATMCSCSTARASPYWVCRCAPNAWSGHPSRPEACS